MNVLSLDDVSLAFGQRKIFDHCSFFLQEGEKVGIIGINGTGKSTLLKLIAGLEEPDEGKRTPANNHLVRFLPQSPAFPPEETVLEAVMKDTQKGMTVKAIAKKRGMDPALVEQIARLYVTHPGVTADGIMTKMGLLGKL